MGVAVDGIEELVFALTQGPERARRGISKQMEKEANDIADLARRMAPVDEGFIEAAIKVRKQTRGSGGRFARVSYLIEVDGDMDAGESKSGKVTKVGDYAWLIHEHLAPFGSYKLGPKSVQKQLSDPSVMVGGKFLERAVAEFESNMVNRLVKALRREMDQIFDDDL